MFTLWFVIHTMVIVIDGLVDESAHAEVGVILGNKVNEDGTLSERLEKRMEKGVQLFKDSLIKIIIVSGGLGKEGHFEGSKMYEYLIKKGIPSDKIIIDNAGVTTEASAENARKLIGSDKRVTVISQYYHITRTKLAFHKNGFNVVYGAHPSYFELRDFYSIFREFIGYYKYLLF